MIIQNNIYILERKNKFRIGQFVRCSLFKKKKVFDTFYYNEYIILLNSRKNYIVGRHYPLNNNNNNMPFSLYIYIIKSPTENNIRDLINQSYPHMISTEFYPYYVPLKRLSRTCDSIFVCSLCGNHDYKGIELLRQLNKLSITQRIHFFYNFWIHTYERFHEHVFQNVMIFYNIQYVLQETLSKT